MKVQFLRVNIVIVVPDLLENIVGNDQDETSPRDRDDVKDIFVKQPLLHQ